MGPKVPADLRPSALVATARFAHDRRAAGGNAGRIREPFRGQEARLSVNAFFGSTGDENVANDPCIVPGGWCFDGVVGGGRDHLSQAHPAALGPEMRRLSRCERPLSW